MYIVTINQIDPAHLEVVKAEMAVRGAPTIRCVRDEAQGVLVALEGSHRLAAAIALDIQPILHVLDDDASIPCADVEFDDCGYFEGQPTTAGMIRDRIGSPMGTYAGCPILKIEEYIEV